MTLPQNTNQKRFLALKARETEQPGMLAPLSDKKIWDSKILVLENGMILVYSLAAHKSFDKNLAVDGPAIKNLYHRNAYVELFSSNDGGQSFKTCGPVLTKGLPGSFDDERIWTVDACQHENKILLFYTAGSKAGGNRQSLALAISDDGLNFEKKGELLTPDILIQMDAAQRQNETLRYAPLAEDDGEIMALRDPRIIKGKDFWSLLFATKARLSDGTLKPALGHVQLSPETFQVEKILPPILLPQFPFQQLEVPCHIEVDGHFYLFVSAVKRLENGQAANDCFVYRSTTNTASGPYIPAGQKDGADYLPQGHGVFAVTPFQCEDEIKGVGFYLKESIGNKALTAPFDLICTAGRWSGAPSGAWRVEDVGVAESL